MPKFASVAAVAFISTTVSAIAETYVVGSWPGDIDTIPCSAWQRSADGGWMLSGTIKLGASEIDNVGVKGDAAARILDARCGKK
jgi:hypothetical protein